MKRDNKQLYERIMRNVSRLVRKTLNEAYVDLYNDKPDCPKYVFVITEGIGNNNMTYRSAAYELNDLKKVTAKMELIIENEAGKEGISDFNYFLKTNVTALRVGDFVKFEIRKGYNIFILRQK